MTRSKIYLKAAESLTSGGATAFSCVAIDKASEKLKGFKEWSHADDYGEVFSPDNCKNDDFWLIGQFDSFTEKHEWRLTALCLAAAMAEEGDL